MNPMFPKIELVDRYCIAKLKFAKTQANQAEVNFYTNQLTVCDVLLIQDSLDQLYEIHNQIWNLEAELKSGREHELSLDEIGRRAIAIRNLNNQRVALKNSMAEKLHCEVREIKKDHLSE
jgi:hypothetical protein